MKGQSHLIESPDPLLNGRFRTALCGKEIAEASFTFIWDGESMGPLVLNTERVCPKCFKALKELMESRPADSARRYLYGMVPSSEVKRNEEE